MKELKIINARIPDYEESSWEIADILIDDGKIIKIGNVTEDTIETIDANGDIASPGFIDIHAHEDPVSSGEFAHYTANRGLAMGVTTQVVGNCGDNADDISSFCRDLNSGGPLNYVMLVGQNYLRRMVGADDVYKASTHDQLEKMKMLLRNTKQFSPAGLSCGFEYSPGVTTEETIELAKAFDDEGYLISVHFRNDGAKSVDSIYEMAEISKETGYAVQMSHIGSCSAVGYMDKSLEAIHNARENGIDIMCDCYPYTAFCTGIGTAVFDDGCFEKWGKTYSDIEITDGPYKYQRCTKELFEKLRKENPEMNVIAYMLNDDEIKKAFEDPYVMIGSDCGFVNGTGHPRGAGTFPRVLGRYAREEKVITVLEALRKMTIMPADRVHLNNKGDMKEGYDADIVIFNESIIIDRAEYQNPTLPPSGINYVIIDGKIAVRNGSIINNRLGRYIPYQNEF